MSIVTPPGSGERPLVDRKTSASGTTGKTANASTGGTPSATFSSSGIFSQLNGQVNGLYDALAAGAGSTRGRAMFTLEASSRASASSSYEEEGAYAQSTRTADAQTEQRVSAYQRFADFIEQSNLSPEGFAGYFTPEKTSSRIADFTLGFFDKFKERHADLSDAEALSAFKSLSGDALGRGVGEARQILGNVSGDVNGMIDKTHSLALQKVDTLLSSLA